MMLRRSAFFREHPEPDHDPDPQVRLQSVPSRPLGARVGRLPRLPRVPLSTPELGRHPRPLYAQLSGRTFLQGGAVEATRAAGAGRRALRAGVASQLWDSAHRVRGCPCTRRGAAATGGTPARALQLLALDGAPPLPPAGLRTAHCGRRRMAKAPQSPGPAPPPASSGRPLRRNPEQRSLRPCAASEAPAGTWHGAARPGSGRGGGILQVRTGRHRRGSARLALGLPGGSSATRHGDLHPRCGLGVCVHAVDHGDAPLAAPPCAWALGPPLPRLGPDVCICSEARGAARGRGSHEERRTAREGPGVWGAPDPLPVPGRVACPVHPGKCDRVAIGGSGHGVQHALLGSV
uniref:Cytochrome P450 family 27 subfamily B member 1 n=1 Tax=Homo sapiens TaxID=9606 RepID=A0ABB0MVF9_HUMAN